MSEALDWHIQNRQPISRRKLLRKALMPAYDSNLFNPPAPLARVTIRHTSSGATVSDVPMLLDTGADVTLLPQLSVEQLGIRVDSNGGGYTKR
jgi:hypothetical protein